MNFKNIFFIALIGASFSVGNISQASSPKRAQEKRKAARLNKQQQPKASLQKSLTTSTAKETAHISPRPKSPTASVAAASDACDISETSKDSKITLLGLACGFVYCPITTSKYCILKYIVSPVLRLDSKTNDIKTVK